MTINNSLGECYMEFMTITETIRYANAILVAQRQIFRTVINILKSSNLSEAVSADGWYFPLRKIFRIHL